MLEFYHPHLDATVVPTEALFVLDNADLSDEGERGALRGAEAIQQWAKARYGVRLIGLVVQQTFGGFLNFVPHLHVLVSAGGLMESRNRWIHHLKYDERELMCAWRYAVVAFLSEARKRNREEAGVPAAN